MFITKINEKEIVFTPEHYSWKRDFAYFNGREPFKDEVEPNTAEEQARYISIFIKEVCNTQPYRSRFSGCACQTGSWVLIWINDKLHEFNDDLEVPGHSDESYRDWKDIPTIGEILWNAPVGSKIVLEYTEYREDEKCNKYETQRAIFYKEGVVSPELPCSYKEDVL